MAKTVSPALDAFLGSGLPFVGADLYVFTLYAVPPGSSPTAYLTSLDRNVVYTGTVAGRADYGTHVYQSMGQNATGAPAIQRSKLSMGIGLQPSKIDIEIFSNPTLVNWSSPNLNQPLLVTMAKGLWANAGVFVRRAYLLPTDLPGSGTGAGTWAATTAYGPATWNSGTTYPQGALVYYSGAYYTAISTNVGNAPSSSPAYWLNVFIVLPGIIDPKGHIQRVTIPGTSGGSAPAWNDSGGTTTDGSVTWQDQGANSWNTPIPTNLGGAGDGTLIWFAGNVGKITELGPLSAKFEARDPLWLLNRPFPKNLYGACYHKLFDAGCGLSQAAFTVADTVQTGSTAQVINTTQTKDQNLPGPPVAGLTLSDSNFGHSFTLPATTYYVCATYTTANGETLPGPISSRAVAPNRVLIANPPPSVAGATGWSIYIGTSLGDLQQQVIFTDFVTNYNESSDGIYLSGTFPPTQPTDGYFSLGTLTVTYSTGTLAGQSVSATIETSSWNGTYGQMFLRTPLPQIPAVSDPISLTPGCAKTQQACVNKFGYNPLASPGTPPFPSFTPYIPTPEAGA